MPRSLAGGDYSLSKRYLVCQGTKKHSTGEPADNRVCCSPRCKQPGASVPVLGTSRHQICRSCRCRFDRPNLPRYKVRIVSHIAFSAAAIPSASPTGRACRVDPYPCSHSRAKTITYIFSPSNLDTWSRMQARPLWALVKQR